MASSAVVERAARNQTVSETVVSTVAEFIGSEPTSIDPLYDTVDPDALDALFDGDRTVSDCAPSRVAFTYCGCDVVVTADGTAQVSRAGAAPREHERTLADNARS